MTIGNPRLAIAALALLTLAAPARASESPSAFLAEVDGNGDKTLSLAEVSTYALKRYEAMAGGHDDMLTAKELGDRMTAEEFKDANTKHSTATPSLSRSEFTVYVAKLFGAANKNLHNGATNVSGTLSERELATEDGKRLIKLLEKQ